MRVLVFALHHFSVVMDLYANDLQLGHHPEIAVSVGERIQWRQMRKACRRTCWLLHEQCLQHVI